MMRERLRRLEEERVSFVLVLAGEILTLWDTSGSAKLTRLALEALEMGEFSTEYSSEPAVPSSVARMLFFFSIPVLGLA